MSNLYPQDLAFLEEAKQAFEKNSRLETYRNDEESHIALRYGEDRDCIKVYHLGFSLMFVNNIMKPAPRLIVEGESK